MWRGARLTCQHPNVDVGRQTARRGECIKTKGYRDASNTTETEDKYKRPRYIVEAHSNGPKEYHHQGVESRYSERASQTVYLAQYRTALSHCCANDKLHYDLMPLKTQLYTLEELRADNKVLQARLARLKTVLQEPGFYKRGGSGEGVNKDGDLKCIEINYRKCRL